MKNVITNNLNQLAEFIERIPDEKYVQKINVLSGSSIGQHMRHILEFYIALLNSQSDTINYDNRERDKIIENCTETALATTKHLLKLVPNLNEQLSLNYTADFTSDGDNELKITSSFGRELAYCLEHSIHHQALIKAALIELNLKHLVEDDFGVAYSTIRYNKKVCAQ